MDVFNLHVEDMVCNIVYGEEVKDCAPNCAPIGIIPLERPSKLPVPDITIAPTTPLDEALWLSKQFERIEVHEQLFEDFSLVVGQHEKYSDLKTALIEIEALKAKSGMGRLPIGVIDMIYCERYLRRQCSILFQTAFAEASMREGEMSLLHLLRSNLKMLPSLRWLGGVTARMIPWPVSEQLRFMFMPNLLTLVGKIYVVVPNDTAVHWKNWAANCRLIRLVEDEDHLWRYQLKDKHIFLLNPRNKFGDYKEKLLERGNTVYMFANVGWCAVCRKFQVIYHSKGEFVTIYSSYWTSNGEVLISVSRNPQYVSFSTDFNQVQVDRAILNYYTLVMSRTCMLLRGVDPKVMVPWISNDGELSVWHDLPVHRDKKKPAKITHAGLVLHGCLGKAHEKVFPNLGHPGDLISGLGRIGDKSFSADYQFGVEVANEQHLFLSYKCGDNDWKPFPRISRQFMEKDLINVDYYKDRPKLSAQKNWEMDMGWVKRAWLKPKNDFGPYTTGNKLDGIGLNDVRAYPYSALSWKYGAYLNDPIPLPKEIIDDREERKAALLEN